MRSILLGGVVVAVVAGCGGSSGSSGSGGAEVEPTVRVGETDQGLRVRLEPVGGEGADEVRLRIPANCDSRDHPDDSLSTPLHRHPLTVEVGDDGGFEVDEDYVEDGTDGDETHVDVRVEGAYADDGTARGTLDATIRGWNGQSEEFGADCTTGTVEWTADRPPNRGDDVVVPVGAPGVIAAAGPDLVVRTGAGELLRVDAADGEAEGLDGSGSGDTTVPSTVASGGATAAPAVTAPLGPTNLAVVAGGVWAADPVTGVVTRHELDGGAATATVDQPLDQLVAGPDALWTVSTNPFRTAWTLDRRDPRTGEVQASAPVNRGGIAAGPAGVWFAHGTLAGGLLSRVDPASLALGEPFDVEIPQISESLVTAGDRIWWIDLGDLTSIDLATGEVAVVDLPSDPGEIAGDGTGVWTFHEQEAVVRRIEGGDGGEVVRTVDVADGWWDLAVGADGLVWLAGRDPEGDGGRAVRLDPAVTGG